MRQRTVFLDFDGVIATGATYSRWFLSEWDKGHFGEPPMGAYWRNWRNQHLDENKPGVAVLDPECCAQVQQLCTNIDAVIVISSSWRKFHSLGELLEMLQERQVTAPVVGATPVLGVGVRRGREIQEYAEAHGILREDLVVLEDEEDVKPYRGRQIRTAFVGPRQGFTARHRLRAERLFQK